MGAGGTALLGRRQSVVGSRGGRVYVKSSRVVATMGGVGRRRTGRNNCRLMPKHHSSDLGVLFCSDEKTDPLKMGCCCPAEQEVPLQSEFAVKKASTAANTLGTL